MQMHIDYPRRPSLATVDPIIILEDISWVEYEALADKRGERAQPKMSYLDGRLELMTTSKPHEEIKKMIARLLEFWAVQEGVELNAFGNYTIKNPAQRRAAEADECYVVGDPEKEPPDLAIEVIWTHGGLDKLEVYRGLGVGELWLWNDGVIEVHVLKRGRYARREKSELLPDFDLKLVEKLLPDRNQLRVMRAFESALKRRKRH